MVLSTRKLWWNKKNVKKKKFEGRPGKNLDNEITGLKAL
jgi:hypothetical protein